MSGLDSIALAVAHLEEMSKRAAEESGTGVLPTATLTHGDLRADRISPSPTMAMASIPHPLSVSKNPSARVVSSDSLDLEPVECSDVNAYVNFDASVSVHVVLRPQDGAVVSSEEIAENSATLLAMNMKLEEVLADPEAWLQSMAGKSIPRPPEGTFQGAKVADVLCGRGGESNHHPGNQAYRRLVKAFQPLYIASKRRFKPKISECIVYTIRQYGGRFLRRSDPRRSVFDDVGNTKAREKTSQALREGAPELRGPAPSSLDNETNDDVAATQDGVPVAVSPTGLGSFPPAVPPAHYMNAHILHSQMEAYFPFGPATPFQQMLMMGGSRGVLPVPVVPSGSSVVEPLVLHNDPPVTESEAGDEAGKKRSVSSIVSEDSTSQTGSLSSTSIGSGNATEIRLGGPRLKRFKQRLIEEHSEDDE